MQKSLLIFLFFIAAATLACTEKNKKEQVNLTITQDTLAFRLGKNVPSQSISSVVHYFTHNGKPYLGYQNEDGNNEIILYDFNTQKMVKHIKYQHRGPDGVGEVDGFHPFNFDSIFVTAISEHLHTLFLTDTSGAVIKKIKFDILGNKDNLRYILFPLRYCNSNPLFKVKNKLYARTYPAFGKIKGKQISNYSPGVIYDLQENTQRKTPFHYPDIEYKGHPIGFRSDYFKGRFVYSYVYHDAVFAYSNDTVMNTYSCKSAYREKPFVLTSSQSGNMSSMTRGEIYKESLKHPMYMHIMHDPYRNVVYRFFVPGIQVKKHDDIGLLHQCKKTFSIMVLNEQFEVIGETLLPEMTVSPNLWFINEDGLYIIRHLGHPHYDPDYLVFHKLQLEGKT